MKLNGGIFLLRISLEKEKTLTDQELRLWLLFRRICVWDKKKIDFGTITVTNAEIMRHLPRPGWSMGKISLTQKNLIKKGLLSRLGRSRYKLPDADILFRKSFREHEIAVRGNEEAFRYIERKQKPRGFLGVRKSAQNTDLSEGEFHPAELGNVAKETIKKNKEMDLPIKNSGINGVETLPPWRDPERVKQFKENHGK